MIKRLSGMQDRIIRLAHRPWYPGLLALVAASDYFVPGAPTNAIFIGSVLPRTDRWRSLSLFFALGCAFGTFLLATLMALTGDAFTAWVAQSEAADVWQRIDHLIARYGLFTLAALALISAPVRIAVAILAMTGYAPWVLAAIVLAGRLVAYPTLAWLVARGPKWIGQTRLLKRLLNRNPPPAQAVNY